MGACGRPGAEKRGVGVPPPGAGSGIRRGAGGGAGVGRAAAGGRGALPGAAHPGSCAVRPSVCPQALSQPVEPPEPWAAGASRAQVSGCPWGEGTKRSLRRVGVSKEPRGLRSSACATGGPGGGGAAPGGWAPNPGLREESAHGPGRLPGPKYGPEREEAGARALESWYREWGCRGRGALTPAHHLPAPGCSPSPPASPGLYCSGRCCCCSWGQRLPRIRRSPTATRWGPWGHWPGMGWAGTQTRILGWLLLGRFSPSLVGGAAGAIVWSSPGRVARLRALVLA